VAKLEVLYGVHTRRKRPLTKFIGSFISG